MTENTDLEFTFGKMADNMKVTGTTVNNMEKESIVKLMELSVVEDGMKASVLLGQMNEIKYII